MNTLLDLRNGILEELEIPGLHRITSVASVYMPIEVVVQLGRWSTSITNSQWADAFHELRMYFCIRAKHIINFKIVEVNSVDHHEQEIEPK